MPWLLVTIFAYFLYAVVILIDKYLLVGPIPNPKVYSFYVGMLGILVLLLIPFGFLKIPEFSVILLALLAGASRIFALFFFFTALKSFEASRVVPAVGGFLPLFTFGLIYIFTGGKEILEFQEFIAFILLILGSMLISWEKSKVVSLKSLSISALAAFLFAFSFVLSKFVYLKPPFLLGLIWILAGSFLTALFFIISREVREELFKRRVSFEPKIAGIFIFNQAMGGGAFLLQNLAIFLAPLSFLPMINALEGMKYAFVFIMAVSFSLKFPKILKEEISKKILFQKIIAILLIGVGLVILAMK